MTKLRNSEILSSTKLKKKCVVSMTINMYIQSIKYIFIYISIEYLNTYDVFVFVLN